jgi:broad specificity phosphatase PhoE
MVPRVSTHFLLIRHAESLWNAERRWQGRADPPLSAQGVAQAEALAATLVGERADHLYCSDLERAHHTARIVGKALGLAPEPDPRLRELDVGTWEGSTRAEITARDAAALAHFDSGDPDAPGGGGESRGAMRERIRAVIDDLERRHRGERLVVVAHLGVILALLPDAELPNAGIVRAVFEDFDPAR